jgi:hypothetical protein
MTNKKQIRYQLEFTVEVDDPVNKSEWLFERYRYLLWDRLQEGKATVFNGKEGWNEANIKERMFRQLSVEKI